MNRLHILLLLLMLACIACADPSRSDASSVSMYGKKNDREMTYYFKREISGCVTELRLNENWSSIDLIYGDMCDVASDKLDSVADIAASFESIVRHFSLGDIVKSKETLTIDIGWKVSHWPLIKHINENKAWPGDIFHSLRLEYPDKKTRHKKYKNVLRNEIMQKKVYFPFVVSMQQLGCQLSPSEYYADPIYMDSVYLSKEDLIEWGVFTSSQAKKNVYPDIKGPIIFDMVCNGE